MKVGSQYDTTQRIELCSLRVDACRNAMQRNARTDLDSILVFLCIAFLVQIIKKSIMFNYTVKFCVCILLQRKTLHHFVNWP